MALQPMGSGPTREFVCVICCCQSATPLSNYQLSGTILVMWALSRIRRIPTVRDLLLPLIPLRPRASTTLGFRISLVSAPRK